MLRSRARLLAQASVEWVLIIAIVGLGCVAGFRALTGEMGGVLGKTGNVLAQGDPVGPVEPEPGTPGGSGTGGGEEPEPTDSVYAMLYADGSMVFQNGNGQDASHGELVGKWNGWIDQEPSIDTEVRWYSEKEKIKSVVFKDAIAPKSMAYWFSECRNLISFNYANLDTSRVVSMRALFQGCTSLPAVYMPEMNVPECKDMSWMFDSCMSITDINVWEWKTPKLENLSHAFSNCTSLVNNQYAEDAHLLMAWWDLSNLKDASYLCYNQPNAVSFAFNGLNVPRDCDLSYCFYRTSLQKISLSSMFILPTKHTNWLPSNSWRTDDGQTYTMDTIPDGSGDPNGPMDTWYTAI